MKLYFKKTINFLISFTLIFALFGFAEIEPLYAKTKISAPEIETNTIFSSPKDIGFYWKNPKGTSGTYVYRKVGNASWKKIATLKGKKSDYWDEKAKKDTTYQYKLKSFKKNKKKNIVSSYSNTIKTRKFAGKIKNLKVEATNDPSTVIVSWTGIKNINDYEIGCVYRDAGGKYIQFIKNYIVSDSTSVSLKLLNNTTFDLGVHPYYSKDGCETRTTSTSIKFSLPLSRNKGDYSYYSGTNVPDYGAIYGLIPSSQTSTSYQYEDFMYATNAMEYISYLKQNGFTFVRSLTHGEVVENEKYVVSVSYSMYKVGSYTFRWVDIDITAK